MTSLGVIGKVAGWIKEDSRNDLTTTYGILTSCGWELGFVLVDYLANLHLSGMALMGLFAYCSVNQVSIATLDTVARLWTFWSDLMAFY